MLRRILVALLIVVWPVPAWAVKEWYDHYLEARDHLMRDGKYAEALVALREAVRLRPTPGLNQQTYGLQFLDYLPYYQMGVCYLRLEDFNSAIRMFNIEDDNGAIRKSDLFREMVRLKAEAEDADRQRVGRLAREEVQRLLKEGNELARAHKFPDALARLAQAQAGAAALDPQTQRTIRDTIDRIRGEEKGLGEAVARSQRIDQALADARRLLEGGQATEALVRFDEVLGLDPKNTVALDGRRDAQERVLASTTQKARDSALREGKSLFDAGRYEDALRPLTDAAADPDFPAARDYLERARKILEGTRQQKELRLKIEALLKQGEGLLAAKKYPEAQVTFESLLALDAGSARGKQGLAIAENGTGRALFNLWRPNLEPSLTVFEPASQEADVETKRVMVLGIAADDRGVAWVEFQQEGRPVARVTPPPSRIDAFDSALTVPFNREFSLKPGLNEIAVIVTDTDGVKRTKLLRINRLLHFWETRAFLPSVVAGALGLIGLGLALQGLRRRRAVRSRFNPYIAGAPVMDDDMFFGRQKLLQRLLNVLHHNSLMITGERRIGKTTFLYHLRKTLAKDDGPEYRFFPVFTDLQGVPESAFFHAVMSDVVDALDLAPATLAALRFRVEGPDYDGRDFSHDLQRVVEELKTRTPKKVKLALLIDEVDVLNEYSERVNQRLRSIFMKTFSEHLVAIMSGVGIKRTWKSEVSPWYNFFDEIELSAFSREEAEDLIRRPVEGIFRYEPDAVEAILGGSQLKPYVIQKFCIHAVSRILEDGRTTVTVGDVASVRDTVLFEGGRAPEPALHEASA